MSWLNLFNKEQKEEENKSPQVLDYPKQEYSVYWEVIPVSDTHAEVRFISRAGGFTEVHAVHAPAEKVQQFVNKLIVDKMETFKVI